MPRPPDEPEQSRFGVIDIGSNTVRLVVFDGRTRSPAYFFNEKDTCALGAEIQSTGALYPEGKIRALAALKRFRALAASMRVDTIEVVATAAMRDASDGPEFATQIRQETGLPVRIISGVEEGRYAAMGVLLGEMRRNGVVIDIGGASMEVASLRDGRIGTAQTTPLGPLRLASTGLTGDDLDAYIRESLRDHWPEDAPIGSRVTLVGGGWRAFGQVDMSRRDYPLHVLQGYEMTPEDALATAKWIEKADEEALSAAGLSRTRIANAPLTAYVLEHLIAFAKPKIIGISAYGLREGVLYENLSQEMRASDPLLQSAAFMEQMDSRFPGFGMELAEWAMPIFPGLPERLLVAACLLADVNWRVHPDYRAAACFATATQSNLAGLTHPERVLLATALAYRYKGSREALKSEPACGLLSGEERNTAEALGRTIRLGAMLSGAAPGVLADSGIARTGTGIRLTLPAKHKDLLAGIVEKRLRSLANGLGLEAEVETLG